MTAAEAETILQYYADIPKRRRAVLRERAELEAQYSTLRGNALDGMPHASGNSDGTADQALRMTEKDTARRLGELDVLADNTGQRGGVDPLWRAAGRTADGGGNPRAGA